MREVAGNRIDEWNALAIVRYEHLGQLDKLVSDKDDLKYFQDRLFQVQNVFAPLEMDLLDRMETCCLEYLNYNKWEDYDRTVEEFDTDNDLWRAIRNIKDNQIKEYLEEILRYGICLKNKYSEDLCAIDPNVCVAEKQR